MASESNHTAEITQEDHLISILNFNEETAQEIIINSPRSLQAC